MSITRRGFPAIPAPLIGAVLAILAVADGRLLSDGRTSLGVGLVLAVAFAPLIFLDLAVAIAVWLVIAFIANLSVLSVAPTAVEIIIALSWLGSTGARRGRLPVVRENIWLFFAVLLLGAWLMLTVAWAGDPGVAAIEASRGWWVSLFAFVIVATTPTKPRDVRVICFGFVAGAMLAVVLGLLGIGGETSVARASQVGNRLTGGGDPNFQAAGFVAALYLAGGLIAVVRKPRDKRFLLVGAALITVGFFATESRGGLVALALSTVAALAFLPRHRRQILAGAFVAGVGLAIWASIKPGAVHRITSLTGSTNGRSDLWKIAWQIFKSHPVAGIGLNMFIHTAPHYAVLQTGRLTDVHLVVEQPEVAHNTYLQLAAEAGLVGLILFLVVGLMSMRCAWLAAQSFDRSGRPEYANLARAVLIGAVGMCIAVFFLTDGDDSRLWVLFGLGPVLLTMARLGVHDPAASVAEPRSAPPRGPPNVEGSIRDNSLALRPIRLRADERALLSLILRQGKSYDELATFLRVEEGVVRERVHLSLRRLAPADSPDVPDDVQMKIGDYLLGQQTAEAGDATLELISGSVPARRWARTLQRALAPIGAPSKPLADRPS